jgi:hypothetical protein
VEEKERDKGRGGRDEQEVNKILFQPHDEAVVGPGRYADQVLSNECNYKPPSMDTVDYEDYRS